MNMMNRKGRTLILIIMFILSKKILVHSRSTGARAVHRLRMKCVASALAGRALHRRSQAERLEHQDGVPAEVDLPERPAEAGGGGLGVVVAGPSLAPEEGGGGARADILWEVVARFGLLVHVGNVVDEALGVQGDPEPHRTEPEECRNA